MRQGQATTSIVGSTKVEPRAHAVDVCTVSEMGIHQVPSSTTLYKGRGLEAPMVGTTQYEHGSQGKHK